MQILIVLGTFLLSVLLVHSSPTDHDDLSIRSPSGSKTVIIEMFEWNWESIATECTNFIGPAGYGFVQGFNISLSTVSQIES